MTSRRLGGFVALALTGAIALAGCGSDSGGGGTASGGKIAGIDCSSGSLKASGSSAQKNAMAAWINAYQTACSGATINYQANGSGSGVTDFLNKQTAFAGSDSALKDDEQPKADARCAAGPAINVPTVGGAIVMAFNVDGVDKLNLTPAVIAGIFSSAITKWDDPKIAAVNSGVTLPAASIAQFHRSDSSGTTDNFAKYLVAAATSSWTYGKGKDWTAPGGQGAKGNDGIGAALKATKNSIGYVELSFALDNGLKSASVDNGGGPVEPNADTAAATLAGAKVTGTGNNLPLDIDRSTKDPKSYPIILVTYQIACEKGGDQPAFVKSFLSYTATDEGQSKLKEIGYVPITGDLLAKVRTALGAIS